METIDYAAVKNFWENRTKKRPAAGLEALVNFEEDNKRLQEKIRWELDAVIPAMELKKQNTIVDLGAGYGQWAMRFAPMVRTVLAVDYQKEMIALGKEISSFKDIKNIDFIYSPVEKFCRHDLYDCFFLSGILHYLDDGRAERVANNIKRMTGPGSIIVLREPTSITGKRHVLNNVYSPNLGTSYSSLYRTVSEISALFTNMGFALSKATPVFPPNSGMDKFPETRLFLYQFKYARS